MPFKDDEARRRYCREYHKAWYQIPENARRKKATAARVRKEQIKRNREFLQDLKSTSRCCTCEESDPCCLEFHHKDSDKEYNISDMIKQAYSLARIRSEISKCCIMCRNCHAKVHAGRLRLPGD